QQETEQEEAEQEEEKIIVEFRKEENESGRNENALYLTKLFSREEEAFSTWKLCIVQDGDSLDTIANRYNTNVQNILRVNKEKLAALEEEIKNSEQVELLEEIINTAKRNNETLDEAMVGLIPIPIFRDMYKSILKIIRLITNKKTFK
ncbi:LysM domain-containing protein, partial [Priestia megaterium]|uniref:LysM domain-containing protein n=1 Tax=Priestia megaterium TaxID=1404 RepID=UPI002FFE1F15